MKTKILASAFVCFLLIFSACNNESVEPQPKENEQPDKTGVKGTVNGVDWTAVFHEAKYLNNIITINTLSGDNSEIKIQLVATSGKVLGEHKLQPSSVINKVTYVDPVGVMFATNNYADTDPVPGKVMIAAMDETALKMTGVCQTKVVSAKGDELTIDITFTDISFTTK